MLSRTTSLTLAAFLAASCGAVACAPPEVDDVDGQGAAVTGSSDTESSSPLVYVFDSKDTKAKPACVGVKIGEKYVLTVKGCGSDSSVVRQASKDGATKPLSVTKIHAPPSSSSSSTTTTETSELRVLELASKIQGPDVKLGPLALKDGYTVLGADTLNAEEKDAALVDARIESQTGAVGKLVLTEKDQHLCKTDLGAPVFSKHPTRVWGFLWKTGDWVLSGMVSGASTATATNEGTAPPSATDTTGATGATGTEGCSSAPWNAAAVSAQSAWLAKFAPAQESPSSPSSPSGGSSVATTPKPTLQACSLVTQKLPEVKTGARSALVEAKATYTNLTTGAARAQIGIAAKATPTKMTWTPATVAESTGERVDVRIQGGVDAPGAEGDFLVLVRASADGGLTWTECDLDGSANGASPSQALALRVASTAPATTTPAPASNYSPSASDDGASSDTSKKKTAAEEGDSTTAIKTSKKAAAGGCSVSQPTSSTPSQGLPAAGLLLGLAALARRRKPR
jgi:MYXO-CTERM domain-containing protein